MLDFFASETVRKIFVSVLLVILIFYGAFLRSDSKNKSKLPQLDTFGKAIHVIAILNAVALLATDFGISRFGVLAFVIALGVCIVIDVVAIVFVATNTKKIKENAKTFEKPKK